MNELRKAAQQALEALEDACGNRCNAENNPCYQRIVAGVLRAALAQPEPTHVHEWFKTGAMSVDEMRCIQCGEWRVKP